MGLCLSAVSTRGRQYSDEEALLAGQSCNIREAAYAYHPRHPEESILYHVVAENIESFLARQLERGRVVPRFVEKELRAFLDCGILARGFLRIHCDECGLDRVPPFSCKGERIALRIERLMIRLGMTAQSGSEKDVEFGNEQPLLAKEAFRKNRQVESEHV